MARNPTKFTESTTFTFEPGKKYTITIVGGYAGISAKQFNGGGSFGAWSNGFGGDGGLVTFRATFTSVKTENISVGTKGTSIYNGGIGGNDRLGTNGTGTSLLGIVAAGGHAVAAPNAAGATTKGESGGSAANPNVINPVSGVNISVEMNGTASSNIDPYCEIQVVS